MQAQKKVHFQQKAWVNTIMCLVSFWYWRWFNSLYILIHLQFFVFDTEIGFANPLFSWFRRFICTFLFPGQTLLGQPLFPRFPTFIYPSSFLIFVFSNHPFFFRLAFELKTFTSFSYVVFGFFYFWKANVQFLDSREHFANHCKVFNSFNGKQSTFPKWVGHPMQIPEMSIKNFKALFWILNHCKIIYSNR